MDTGAIKSVQGCRVFALVSLLLLAGCGTGRVSPQGLPKAVFHARAVRICGTMDRTMRRLPSKTATFDQQLNRVDALLSKLGTIQPRGRGATRAWRYVLRSLRRVYVSVRANDHEFLTAAKDLHVAEYSYPLTHTPKESHAYFLQAFKEVQRVSQKIGTDRQASQLAHASEKLRLYSWCGLQSVVPAPVVH
jgi:hypothetical protein